MGDSVLVARWRQLAGPSPAAAEVGEDLLARYAEPHRRYHDATHLREVLDHVEELAPFARDAEAVRLAAWFHDAVYDPERDDNEERSALLAEDALARLGLPARRTATVARLVRLTATHAVDADDRDGAVLCDADLAVLAAPPARYAAYAAGVREEYGRLDEQTFRAGRAAVLRRLLDLPALFHTPDGRTRYAERARHNMWTELALLDRSG